MRSASITATDPAVRADMEELFELVGPFDQLGKVLTVEPQGIVDRPGAVLRAQPFDLRFILLHSLLLDGCMLLGSTLERLD